MIFYLRFTVNLHEVVTVPMLLLAWQAYSPSSSGNTSLITRVATPPLYFKLMIPDELSV